MENKGNTLSLLLREVIYCVRRKEFLENSRPQAYRELKKKRHTQRPNATTHTEAIMLP